MFLMVETNGITFTASLFYSVVIQGQFEFDHRVGQAGFGCGADKSIFVWLRNSTE